MRVALVALPWSVPERPASAIAALAAYLDRELPEVQVAAHHAYVDMAFEIGFQIYRIIAQNAYEVGELIFCASLYPERRERILDFSEVKFASMIATFGEGLTPEPFIPKALKKTIEPTWRGLLGLLMEVLDYHLEQLAKRLASEADVIGLTTCYGQLFANLSFAKKVRAINPNVKIIVGGSTISGSVGPSVVAFYDQVDYIVQGEGEHPLCELLSRMLKGEPVDDIKGVLTKTNAPAMPNGAELWEVRNMDDLPYPRLEEYAELATQYRIAPWFIGLEGSRGCWWDRSKKAKDPKKTCYFCNLNVQWMGYREKSVERLVREVDAMTSKHDNLALFFLDNIIRLKSVEEFALALKATQREYTIFYEMRVNVRPYELLLLWEAGLRVLQFGIEALSTSLLRRIGKGTMLIQNLQGMKICREFGIDHGANLLTKFPGSTDEEVAETVDVIDKYAYSLQPLNLSRFWLGVGQTVDHLRKEFPITNIRSMDFYRVGVPDDAFEKVRFFDMDYDPVGTPADWAPVRDKVMWWVQMQTLGERDRPGLHYLDGHDFLNIFTKGPHRQRSKVLRGVERDLYLFVSEIRTREEIEERFAGRLSPAAIDELFESWIEDHYLIKEGSRYLSMAMAMDPYRAGQRIRRLHEEDQRFKAERKRIYLVSGSAQGACEV